MSFVPILFSALASSIFVHAVAVPAPQPPIKDAFQSITRTPAILPRGFQVGDLLFFENNAILRRDNDSSAHELVANYSSGVVDNPVKRVIKRADLVFPADVDLSQDADELEDYGIAKCGEKFIFVESSNIGQGGFASVSRGIDKDGKIYALKMLKDRSARDEEFRIMQLVGSHPTIVEVYEKCRFGVYYTILMELVNGEDVDKKVAVKLYQNEAVAKLAFAGILDAVDYVHSKGVAHLDIKGANVMIGAQDGVKLIDFGMATQNSQMDKIDVAGGIRSPEAESGNKANTKLNDVWEIGTLFVNMLIGSKPWSDANAANAKKIWDDRTKAQRVKSCMFEFQKYKFSEDFCGILADIFAQEGDRKALSVIKPMILNPSLKIFDDCDDSKNKKQTGAKREVKNGEMVVTSVEDLGDEWVVRAML
ncbi:kinase-like protein [Periconia macrospinosa]|uniref:Kinase-like protein n=1 Tax=Periconia macrospinosa TaxID=97972 RepID=A0A2V1D2E9_9PLEO|nr:kinase-like protein [Periconia macrospinosa]